MYEVQHKQAHWLINARKTNNSSTHQRTNLQPQKTQKLINSSTYKLTHSSTYKVINSKTHQPKTNQLKNLNYYFLFYNYTQFFTPF
mgnify:CR=1 FL=1